MAQKCVGDENRAFPQAEHAGELVTALFPDGKLHAPEFWITLDFVAAPVEADATKPEH